MVCFEHFAGELLTARQIAHDELTRLQRSHLVRVEAGFLQEDQRPGIHLAKRDNFRELVTHARMDQVWALADGKEVQLVTPAGFQDATQLVWNVIRADKLLQLVTAQNLFAFERASDRKSVVTEKPKRFGQSAREHHGRIVKTNAG